MCNYSSYDFVNIYRVTATTLQRIICVKYRKNSVSVFILVNKLYIYVFSVNQIKKSISA